MTGVLPRFWSRREWLAGLVWSGHQLTRAPWPASGDRLPAVPRVNGGINVHPVRRLEGLDKLPVILPELIALQLRGVYELGFAQLRTTLAIDADGLGNHRSVIEVKGELVAAPNSHGMDLLGDPLGPPPHFGKP